MNSINRMAAKVLLVATGITTLGCQAITNVDRSLIDETGAMGGAGGAGGGAPECNAANDCAASANECEIAVCKDGKCGFDAVPNGTPIAAQTSGDCQQAVCDGAGSVTSIADDQDLPNDGNECTTDSCSMGMPSHTAVVAGAMCMQNGGEVCNAAGECVVSTCGDGISFGTEGCDDGNFVNGDGCDANCTPTACGNGIASAGEVCDDKNTMMGDGCSATCQVEPNYQCTTLTSPGVCILAETNCKNGADDDNDGQADGADSDCGIASSMPECGAGEVFYLFTSRDVAKTLADESSATSNIAVTTGGTVKRAIVRLSILHPFLADIDVSLRSPQSTTVALSHDNGEDGDDYKSTMFSDACATPVRIGLAPFSGCFSPDEPLGAFNDSSPDGVWSLMVSDDSAGDSGVLLDWALALCVAP